MQEQPVDLLHGGFENHKNIHSTCIGDVDVALGHLEQEKARIADEEAILC